MSIDILTEILNRDLPVPQQNAVVAIANTSAQTLPAVIDTSAQANNTVSDDAAAARTNIRTLIAQGATAVTEMMVLAKQSNSPRAYEVLSTLMKTMAEMNHDLMGMHKVEQALTAETSPETPSGGGDVHIDKAVFVGSTSELGQHLKQMTDNNANSSHQST